MSFDGTNIVFVHAPIRLAYWLSKPVCCCCFILSFPFNLIILPVRTRVDDGCVSAFETTRERVILVHGVYTYIVHTCLCGFIHDKNNGHSLYTNCVATLFGRAVIAFVHNLCAGRSNFGTRTIDAHRHTHTNTLSTRVCSDVVWIDTLIKAIGYEFAQQIAFT